ncbi:ATP-binding protein [Larkinella insperata]|uniref:histidine kinase n=1 Tax=Larkinella insperata TaxID=332158 RepID=A0ABW3QCG5_9BACT
MKPFLWLFGLLLLVTRPLLAQPYTARTLSIQHGLPEYYVSGLLQDQAGFVWVATRDGLARYDGRQFKVFRHLAFGKRSLANNTILSLQSVSDTSMLIHLENGGYQLFNPVTEQFSTLFTTQQLEKSRLLQANITLTPDQQQVWGRQNNQLVKFDRQTRRFQSFWLSNRLTTTQANPVGGLLIGTHNRLYAPFLGQLLEFDPRTGTALPWPNPLVDVPGRIETYYGTPLLQRQNGEILISAVGSLLVFNPKTHRFRTLPIPSSIPVQAGILYEANDGTVYFTHAMTVYRLTTNDQLTPLWTAPRIDYQNYFHALLLDRSGVLWIGTNGDGIQQIDLRAFPIKTYVYQTTFAREVLVRELNFTVPEWVKNNANNYRLRLGGSAPFATIRLDGSYILLRGDHNRRTLQPLLKIPDARPIPGIKGGNGLRVLPDGTVWMYNPLQGLLKADSTGRIMDTFACPVNWVMAIQPLGQWVWLASEESGLYAFDLQSRRIVRHLHYQPSDSTSLPSNRVQCLIADPTNPTRLWVGTQDGLGCLDTRTLRFRNWTQSQGLPSATIQTLLADRRGNLWFSTFKGISRIDPRTGQIRHFSTSDGLLDIEFRQNHAMQLPDGRLAFGGGTGVTVFDPLALTEKPEPIATVLTGLRIANQPVEADQDGSPLTRPINATTTLRLRPNQNFLSLEFAGLQYNNPTSLRYRYQLTGVDADWVYAGNHTLANYTQLYPGTYEFRVNAADASGHWSPRVKTLQLIIEPPWWKTWWAYLVYGLLLAGLVRAYIQYRIHQNQLQQEIRLKEQEAQLLKENANWQTSFFTNITHEFRTPLTLIISPLERLMETRGASTSAQLYQQHGIMHRNALRLLRLINQLLDIAKLEAGHLAVFQSRGNLISFFADLVDSFRPRAERKGVEISFQATVPPSELAFDAQKLETIGYNLLSNALKVTPPGGSIRVVLQTVAASAPPLVQLQVIDSGVGIAPEHLNRIFDRFFQGHQSTGSGGSGTGIGLYLVAEFTRLLGGTVQVESQVGQGSTFTVTLPMQEFTEGQTLPDAQPAAFPVSIPFIHPGAESPAERSPRSAQVPLVLVVEDHDELRAFIAQELAGHYRVLTASNGQEGWLQCLAELPELVISDVMMPEIDGFTLVERIKTTPLTAHIAVILLTAKSVTNDRIKGLSAGANDYLTKPFNSQELLLRISNLLQHQQQLRNHWQQRVNQLNAIPAPAPEPVANDPFLLKFYELLDQYLADSGVSVEHLASELAVSTRTLQRKLSTLTGSNANELMRSHRLRKAAKLLRDGCSVSEAAERSGFEGLSYFSKSFKAQFAVSPSAYLQSQKN